jgi:hypothetical protein
LWYAHAADQFVVSTSQRAIVMWLESFDLNEDVLAWQLSSGTLGPGLSWDRRIRALPPASRLELDCLEWSIELHTTEVEYRASARPPTRQRDELKGAIAETFRGLQLDTNRGVIALSGGYDSRMILLMLKERPHLRTVTWGRRGAPEERLNDANIAQQLAAKMHTDHSYFELEVPARGLGDVLERFVRLGEGRTESISGYIDGFSVWKCLHESGYDTLFRGDEAFGCRAAPTPADVYRNMKCNVLADFETESVGRLPDLVPPQERPEHLERQPSESLQAWRDRLNAEFELPYVIGPLNDLKFGYVDVVQPLVSRLIVEQVRRLDDDLRTDKRAFKAIVEEVPLDVPFAKRVAILPPESVLADAPVLRELCEQLRRQSEESGAAAAVARHALELLPGQSGHRVRLRTTMARLVERVRRRAPRSPRLSPLKVAFRSYIIGKMHALLREDAHTLH